MIGVDVGNTKTAIGFFREGRLVKKWTLATDAKQASDQYRATFGQLLASVGESLPTADAMILASVVPEATREWERLRSDLDIHVVSYRTPTSFEIAIEEPSSLGADRIADAEAALRNFGAPVVIVDAGTAIVLSAIDAKRRFIGGAILPGIGISLKALFSAAARLSHVDLAPPERAIGTSTKRAIDSGAHFGYSSLINGMVDKFREELGEKGVPVVATGGSIHSLQPYLRPEIQVDEDLTLHGLQFLYENLGKGRRA